MLTWQRAVWGVDDVAAGGLGLLTWQRAGWGVDDVAGGLDATWRLGFSYCSADAWTSRCASPHTVLSTLDCAHFICSLFSDGLWARSVPVSSDLHLEHSNFTFVVLL